MKETYSESVRRLVPEHALAQVAAKRLADMIDRSALSAPWDTSHRNLTLAWDYQKKETGLQVFVVRMSDSECAATTEFVEINRRQVNFCLNGLYCEFFADRSYEESVRIGLWPRSK